MEGYLIYFLKVIALQTILFGLYSVLSRKNISFHFNRYFLISALVLPFFIPLLNIPVNIFQQNIAAESTFDPWFFIEQSLPLITINGSQAISSSLSWWAIVLIAIYVLVAIISALKLVNDYFRIHRLGKTCIKKEYTPKGFYLLYVPTNILSFSFLNKIFLSDLFPLKNHEKKTIITHEEYHLTQKHSLDIILAEIVRIVCWFNPIILLIQKNLKETHEYLADRHTITHYGQNDYASLLKSFKWQEINMLLGSGYSSSSIKKRLNMMEQSNKKSTILKVLSLLMISLFTAFIFACEQELDTFENKDEVFQYEFTSEDLENEINEKVAKLANAPQDLIDKYIAAQFAQPDFIFMPNLSWVTEKVLKTYTPEELKNSNNSFGQLDMEVAYFRMLSFEETRKAIQNDVLAKINIVSSYVKIRKVNRIQYYEYMRKLNVDDNSIHDDYDKMATFKGGMEALTQHLKENLKYPDIAKEKGIEDRLVMRFVVAKHGSLLYLNVEKEPATVDEEISIEFQKAAFNALRTTTGYWEPAEKDGRYVMSKMTLPIEFKLDQ